MDILERILQLRNRRGWTEWKLAEESGVSQSTISAWYKKGRCPSVGSIENICKTFGITLSQFFADELDLVDLTPEQRELLANWSGLSKNQKETLLALIKNMPPQE